MESSGERGATSGRRGARGGRGRRGGRRGAAGEDKGESHPDSAAEAEGDTQTTQETTGNAEAEDHSTETDAPSPAAVTGYIPSGGARTDGRSGERTQWSGRPRRPREEAISAEATPPTEEASEGEAEAISPSEAGTGSTPEEASRRENG